MSAVWIVPLVALAIGIYMFVHAWLTEGPEIEISFESAEGLEAGKTMVKYRDVEMGLVTDVRLTEEFERVIATVEMEPVAKPLLREDTQFYVVTARVNAGHVSGLETLLSGAYIELAPGDGEPGRERFLALERPPLTPLHAPGLRLYLTSDRARSVSTGDGVFYKGFQVGRVEQGDFDADTREARYVVFIDAPYHKLVDSSVRFWNASGISLSAGAEGFRLETGALNTILLGGVAFARPPDIPAGDPVEAETEFKLYENYDAILENPFRYGMRLVVRFSQSLKGLSPGAPVEYRGIEIGRVERLMFKEMVSEAQAHDDAQVTGRPIPVLIYVEPGRLAFPDRAESMELLMNFIADGVRNGMRASLETGNVLTGAKYVDIDFYPDVEDDAEMGKWNDYATIPTIGTGIDQLTVKLNELLDKINDLPLETTLTNANATMAQLDETLSGLRAILDDRGTRQLPRNLDATLQELREALEGLSPDSGLYRNLNGSLLRLNRTLNNLESLTDTLSRQPSQMVLPTRQPPDPVPGATDR